MQNALAVGLSRVEPLYGEVKTIQAPVWRLGLVP